MKHAVPEESVVGLFRLSPTLSAQGDVERMTHTRWLDAISEP